MSSGHLQPFQPDTRVGVPDLKIQVGQQAVGIFLSDIDVPHGRNQQRHFLVEVAYVGQGVPVPEESQLVGLGRFTSYTIRAEPRICQTSRPGACWQGIPPAQNHQAG